LIIEQAEKPEQPEVIITKLPALKKRLAGIEDSVEKDPEVDESEEYTHSALLFVHSSLRSHPVL